MLHRRRTVALRAAALCLAMTLLSGCWIWGTDQLEIFLRPSGGASIVAVIHRDPTDQIEFAYRIHNNHGRNTLRFLKEQMFKTDSLKNRLVQLAFKITDFDYFFDDVQASDFNGAMNNVLGNTALRI